MSRPKSVERIISLLEKDLRLPLPEEILKDILKNDFIFQAVSWYGDDFIKDAEEEIETAFVEEKKSALSKKVSNKSIEIDDQKSYQIYITGLNENGQSVCLRIKNFTPYFYIEVPDNTTKRSAAALFEKIKEKIYYKERYGLSGHQLVEKMKLYPFTNGTQFKFIRLTFTTMSTFRKCKYMFNKPFNGRLYEVYESNVDPINRFCHMQNIQTTGHIIIKKNKFAYEYRKSYSDEGAYDDTDVLKYDPLEHSTTQIVINANFDDVLPYQSEKINPLQIVSWDIECQSSIEGEFPKPENEGDYVGSIGITLWTYGQMSSVSCLKWATQNIRDIAYTLTNGIRKTKIVITNKKCAFVRTGPFENAVVLDCTSEKELLVHFFNLISLIDPDIIMAFNNWSFDDSYTAKRLLRYNTRTFDAQRYLNKFSRLTRVSSKMVLKKMSSGAYGDNEFNVLECHGRMPFDLLVSLRRDHKLPTYALKFVGPHFTKSHKIDLPYKEVFIKMDSDDPYDIAEVAKYCIQDANVVVDITSNLSIIPNSFEMAKICFIPVDWLLFRGQQCKVFSLVTKKSRERGFVVPIKIIQAEGEFAGASVLEPKRGAFYFPVAGLDFASLYPSIMVAFNLCYCTLVLDDKYKNLPGLEYEVIKWSDGDKNFEYTYVQNSVIEGILPSILTELLSGRKQTKLRMKTEKDPFVYEVLNGKQLGQKITCNSVYGFTGTGLNGILPCREISSCVTARGRQMIDKTKKMAEEMYSCTALYGDSIPAYEKIYFGFQDNQKKVEVSSVENLIKNKWEPYRMFKWYDETRSCKEQIDLTNEEYYTKTASGLSKIKRVIRHLAPNKKLYEIKVKDKEGLIRSVTVTEGHSLIDYNGKPVEADALKIGGFLMDN